MLRTQLRSAYASLSAEERMTADRAITERVLSHPAVQQSETVFLYASVGREVHTYDLIDKLYAQGKTVALPKCQRGGAMEFYRYTGELTEGKFRIPEPVGDELLSPKFYDVMLVPALAYDRAGYRIGQGGGYYDRYMAQHPCVCIGVCRERFVLDEVPRMWNDLAVDYVITESSVYFN